MLDIPFNEAIDIWSLGVTAAELRNDEHDVLSMIRDIGGQPSDNLLDCGKWTPYCFHKQSNWRLKTHEESMHTTDCGTKHLGVLMTLRS